MKGYSIWGNLFYLVDYLLFILKLRYITLNIFNNFEKKTYMKKKIFKAIGLVALAVFTFTSCKKESTTPTGSTTGTIKQDTTKNTSLLSGFAIKVNATSYDFTGDKTGMSKDSSMGAMIMKDKKTGKFQLMFIYQKKDANSDTTMFSLMAKFSSLSNTSYSSTSKDSLMVMTVISGKSGFMYFQDDVQLTFTNASINPTVGSIISGAINGKLTGIDLLTFQTVLHPISGSFKAVYIGEINGLNSNQPVQ